MALVMALAFAPHATTHAESPVSEVSEASMLPATVESMFDCIQRTQLAGMPTTVR